MGLFFLYYTSRFSRPTPPSLLCISSLRKRHMQPFTSPCPTDATNPICLQRSQLELFPLLAFPRGSDAFRGSRTRSLNDGTSRRPVHTAR